MECVTRYREFAPRPELREHIRAFFSFVPAHERCSARRPLTRETLFEPGDPFSAPMFADACPSVVVDLGIACGNDGVWHNGDAPRGNVIGGMTRVGAPAPSRHAAMVGVYFQPARASSFMHLPLSELTDRIVPLDELWGAAGTDLAAELDELSEEARVDRLELELVQRFAEVAPRATSVDVPGLAEWTRRARGQVSVARLADAAGVSRQHLTRVFHEQVGVSPKLCCRLARFHSALGYAAGGDRVAWSRVAAALGYADQSHMIAEFREFSSLTPQLIASGQLFHPFIENARTRHDLSRGRPDHTSAYPPESEIVT